MSKKLQAWSIDRTIESELTAGHHILDDILNRLQSENWTSRDFFGIRLSVEEAVVNAIKHGNRLDPTKQVSVNCRSTPESFWIRVSDQGAGFVPEEVPDCTDPDRIECPNGRGIMLMRNFMDFVEYTDSGRVVTMEKKRPE